MQKSALCPVVVDRHCEQERPVSCIFASWNQLDEWLRKTEGLRWAA